MFFRWRVVFCAIVLLSILDVKPVTGRKGFSGHSYPRSGGGGHRSSGGLSGGGHGYPSPGGHGYPPSGGLSGGNHGSPTSGGSHGYPSPGGSHGYPSPGGSHGYPSPGGGHGYPPSGGLSGNSHGSSNRYPSGGTHTTNVYNNYHYTPPQQIKYSPVSGSAPVSYPVYRGTPPSYVYHIKDSGSKYGTLLTGLALLNLGTLAGTAYAISHSGGNGGSGGSGHYKLQPGEVCKFGVKKDNGDYEETRIDCQLITSFILQDEAKTQNNATNTTVITTVTNITTVNMTNGVPEAATSTKAPVAGGVVYMMMPDGTLVPLNGTAVNTTANTTASETSPNNTMTSTMTVTTTTNTTVTNALDVKGKPIDVTPGMQCFVLRTTPSSRMRKSVPCGLLQTYAEKSIKKNAAGRNVPAFTILAAVIALCLSY